MILKTRRLTLRPLRSDDAPLVHSLMSDAEVMAFWDSTEIEDTEVTGAILQGQLAEITLDRARYWSLFRNDEDAFVGCCDLSEIDRRHHRAEGGFLIGRPFWGEGYAFEAMHAVIHHAAQVLRLKRLSARTQLGNLRSIGLLERLGFEEEGLLRGYIARDGERRDCKLFGLLL
jgi:ribosomal-protein-alanine N-acetyltransferase